MSVVILSYNMPSGAELQPYVGKVPGWIDRALSGLGAVEFRGYRSLDNGIRLRRFRGEMACLRQLQATA
jgi:hypothetical protein